MPKFNPKKFLSERPWGPFLRDVNQALPTKVTLHCLGGFVLHALYNIPRHTADLDYLEIRPKDIAPTLDEIAGPESALAKKYRVHIHSAGVFDMPEDYEDRLTELELGLDKLRIFVPDPYDLLLSKMLRNSPKDRDDAKFLIAKLGLRFGPMRERFDKEMGWIMKRDYHETTLEILWKGFFPR